MKKEIEKLRALKLKEWKIMKLAKLEDRIDTIKEEYQIKLHEAAKYRKEIKNTKFISCGEGDAWRY